MACGEADLACFAFEWLRENEFAAGVFTKFLAQYGEQAGGAVQAIAAFVREHGEKIIAAAGFSFGVWRWWVYREHILHKRLSEYLAESDRRLTTARSDLLQALERPAPGRLARMPLFAPAELVSVLRERNWDRTPAAVTVHSSAQWQLKAAMEQLGRQLEVSQADLASLRNQLATAHILSGEISASQAKIGARDASDADHAALNSFRTALQMPGHEKNLLAREFFAHQLRKLGKFEEALKSYQEMEQIALTLTDARERTMVQSRAKVFQAEIHQFLNSTVEQDGKRTFLGSGNARDLLKASRVLREGLVPFQGWELQEQADIHYISAFVARNLRNDGVEAEQLEAAVASYRELEASCRHRFWSNRADRKLRRKAKAGIARAERAQKTKGDYDWRWLSSD